VAYQYCNSSNKQQATHAQCVNNKRPMRPAREYFPRDKSRTRNSMQKSIKSQKYLIRTATIPYRYVKCSSLSDKNFSTAFVRRITLIVKKILSDTRSVHYPKKAKLFVPTPKNYNLQAPPHPSSNELTTSIDRQRRSTAILAHAVIDSRGGIWTKSVVQRRARLTINQNNETNAGISSSRYRSTYSKLSISSNRHRSTKTIKKKLFES
jgi:hypothetical protein